MLYAAVQRINASSTKSMRKLSPTSRRRSAARVGEFGGGSSATSVAFSTMLGGDVYRTRGPRGALVTIGPARRVRDREGAADAAVRQRASGHGIAPPMDRWVPG